MLSCWFHRLVFAICLMLLFKTEQWKHCWILWCGLDDFFFCFKTNATQVIMSCVHVFCASWLCGFIRPVVCVPIGFCWSFLFFKAIVVGRFWCVWPQDPEHVNYWTRKSATCAVNKTRPAGTQLMRLNRYFYYYSTRCYFRAFHEQIKELHKSVMCTQNAES